MEFADLGIKTKPGSSRYSTTCPKCSQDRKKSKQPCLTVNDEPGNRWWHCNHPTCGWSGNLDMYGKYDEIRKKSRIPEQLARAYSQEFTKYLKGRGFSVKTLTNEKIYESMGRGKQIIIGFPFYIGMTLVNAKFYKLGATENKWFQLPRNIGTKACFWGFGDHTFKITEKKDQPDIGIVTEDEPKNIVIITEGEWDRLTWKECGYKNVLSVPQGAPSKAAKDFKKEFEYANEPYFTHVAKSVDLFYIAVDDDDPGSVLREQLAIILGKEKCRIVHYPIGYKDINEVLVGHKDKKLEPLGKDGVVECYENIGSYPIKGILKPSSLTRELLKFREEGFKPGLGIGVPEIDYLFTVKRKHISFWTGMPSAGKSVVVRWYLTELIRNNADLGLRFGLFPPESRPVEREYAKIAQVITGQNLQKNQWNSMNDETYRKTMNFIERHFFIISPSRYNYESFDGKIKKTEINTLKSILGYIKYLVKTEGIFGYVIDAWNKIEHEQPRNISETNYISSQLDMLIDFNDYYNVHGFIIVHPTKLSKNRYGNYDMPSLYDIKGSSSWYEKADIGIVVHRNKFKAIAEAEKRGDEDDREYISKGKSTPTIIKCEKLRFEELGNIDIVRIKMNKTGGFEVFKDDKGIHEKGKINPEEKKDKQQKLPYNDPEWLNDKDEEEEDLPF